MDDWLSGARDGLGTGLALRDGLADGDPAGGWALAAGGWALAAGLLSVAGEGAEGEAEPPEQPARRTVQPRVAARRFRVGTCIESRR